MEHVDLTQMQGTRLPVRRFSRRGILTASLVAASGILIQACSQATSPPPASNSASAPIAPTTAPSSRPGPATSPTTASHAAPTPTAAATTAPVAKSSGLTLTIWLSTPPPGTPRAMAYKELWDAFQKESGMTLRVESAPYDDYYQRAQTMYAGGGTGIDAMAVPSVNANAAWAKAGMLLPLDDLVAKSNLVKWEDFFPQTLAPTEWNGKRYGLPLSFDCRALAYNTKLFGDAGLKPPTNWQEFLAAAKALTKPGPSGQPDVFGFAPGDGAIPATALCYQFGPLAIGNDGWIVSPDGTKPMCNQPPVVEALDLWKQLVPLMPTGVASMDGGAIRTLFAKNKVAMTFAGPWYKDLTPAINPESVYPKTWDLVLIPGSNKSDNPKTKSGSTNGGWNWSIYSKTQHPEEAFQFIAFCSKPEWNARITSALPVLKAELSLAPFTDPMYKIYVDQMQYSRQPIGIFPAVLAIYQLEADEIQNVMAGKKAPQAAMDDLARSIEKTLKEA